MKKYKIGIVTPTFPPKGGGIATSHYNIYQLLKEHHDIKVFAYNDWREKNEDKAIKRKTPSWLLPILKLGIKLYLRKYGKSFQYTNVIRIISHSIGVWLLNKPLKKFNPDFLIVPDNNVPLYWIKKRDYKIIWFAHHNYARFRNNPLIEYSNPIDIDIACSMERRAIKKADFILAPSNYMIKFLKSNMQIDKDCAVINNFINIQIKDPSNQNFSSSTRQIVYIPSGGTNAKGERYVFEIIRRIALAFNNKISFIISGHISIELRFEINHLNKNISVEYPDQLLWEENFQLLKQCTIVIAPTLIENYSNALVEALSLGKPVVTFDVGGNNEIIDNNENGYIVPYLDIDQLIEKSLFLLNNELTCRKFSQNALSKARKLADSSLLFDKYQEVFNHLDS